MTYTLRVEAELVNLEAIRRHVEGVAAALKVNPKTIPDVLLAVNEMATNVIVHGYQGQPGSIELDIERDRNNLVIRLRDHAPPFDPTLVPPPDVTLPLYKRPLGGMGIYLTRRLMDKVIHRVTHDNGNEVTLIKSLQSSPEENAHEPDC
jgi:anti-sigma regulatory factor (Ser/Thr protein kinase)